MSTIGERIEERIEERIKNTSSWVTVPVVTDTDGGPVMTDRIFMNGVCSLSTLVVNSHTWRPNKHEKA